MLVSEFFSWRNVDLLKWQVLRVISLVSHWGETLVPSLVLKGWNLWESQGVHYLACRISPTKYFWTRNNSKKIIICSNSPLLPQCFPGCCCFVPLWLGQRLALRTGWWLWSSLTHSHQTPPDPWGCQNLSRPGKKVSGAYGTCSSYFY